MPTVIATISLKGGVGKTTLTAGLGEFLAAEFGRRVLLVDLDAQTNLTTMMIGADRWLDCNRRRHTVATLLQEAGVEEAIRMQILGHTTTTSHRQYAHTSTDLTRAALGQLEKLLALET